MLLRAGEYTYLGATLLALAVILILTAGTGLLLETALILFGIWVIQAAGFLWAVRRFTAPMALVSAGTGVLVLLRGLAEVLPVGPAASEALKMGTLIAVCLLVFGMVRVFSRTPLR